MDVLLRQLRQAHPPADAVKAAQRLVLRTAAAVASAEQLTRPDGTRWTSEDFEDLASEVFKSGRFDKLVLTAKNDGHLRSSLVTTIRNLIIDGLRAAGVTALSDRIVDVLAEGPFEKRGALWAAPGASEVADHTVRRGDLVKAAYDVPVKVWRQRPDAQRGTSYASRADLVAMLHAVLARAGGPLELGTLCDVARARLGLMPVPDSVEPDTVEHSWRPTPEDEVVGDELAVMIWRQLSPSQRQVLPYLDESARQLEARYDETGLRKSAANAAQRGAAEIIREHVEGSSEGEQIATMHRLLAICGSGRSAGHRTTLDRERE